MEARHELAEGMHRHQPGDRESTPRACIAMHASPSGAPSASPLNMTA